MTATSPTTCLDVLPTTEPTAIRWVRGGEGKGLLYIEDRKRTACYIVDEFPCQFEGRAFKFRCAGGQSDKDVASYEVFIGRGDHHRCDCKGFSYSRTGKPCKHILAAIAVWDNGWLDLANGEQDTANVEG